MSAETLQAVEDALRAHMAEVEERIKNEPRDEDDEPYHEHILSDWAVVFSTSGLSHREDGSLVQCNDVSYICAETSMPVSTLGLAVWLETKMKAIMVGELAGPS